MKIDPTEELALATEIAEECCIDDLHAFTASELIEGERWRDIGEADNPDSVAFIERAVRYLRMRDLIVDHPTRPQLIRVIDPRDRYDLTEKGVSELRHPNLGRPQ